VTESADAARRPPESPAAARRDRAALKGIARQAYRFVFANFSQFLRRAAVPALFLVPAALVDHVAAGSRVADPLGVRLGLGLMAWACHVSFAVSWHRMVLLGEPVHGMGIRLRGREVRFAALSFLPLALCGAVVVPLGLLGSIPFAHGLVPDGALKFLFLIGLVSGLVWCSARLVLIFPAAAIDRPIPWRMAWRRSRPVQREIIGAVLCAVLPGLGILAVLAAIADRMSQPWAVLAAALGVPLSLAIDAVAIGTASLIFHALTEPDQVTPEVR